MALKEYSGVRSINVALLRSDSLRSLAHDTDLYLRRIRSRMMNSIPRDYTLRLVPISTASVQVSIEAREVTARNLNSYSMTRFEVITRRHRLQRHFVDFARLYPDVGFVVAIAVSHSLNCFIKVVSTAIRIYVKQLHREVCVLRIARYVKSDFNR